MLRRFLNIATIVCLVLCVVLMGMWVRSYQSLDELRGRITDKLVFTVDSASGRLLLISRAWSDHWTWAIERHRLNDQLQFDFPAKGRDVFEYFGFKTYSSPNFSMMFLPYWIVVLTSGSLATVLRLRWPWRFTLRSLFIATTFLAALLGMIAWLDRAWIGK
jgi:hypothetical protein